MKKKRMLSIILVFAFLFTSLISPGLSYAQAEGSEIAEEIPEVEQIEETQAKPEPKPEVIKEEPPVLQETPPPPPEEVPEPQALQTINAAEEVLAPVEEEVTEPEIPELPEEEPPLAEETPVMEEDPAVVEEPLPEEESAIVEEPLPEEQKESSEEAPKEEVIQEPVTEEAEIETPIEENKEVESATTEEALPSEEMMLMEAPISPMNNPLPTFNLEGYVFWNDNNNSSGDRPPSITLTLLANGVATTLQPEWNTAYAPNQ